MGSVRSASLVVLLLASSALAKPGKPAEFPTFGVALTPPDGFVRGEAAGAEQVGRWFKTAKDGKTVQAMLSVEVSPKHGRTLAGFAEQAASRNIAEVDPAGGKLGGAAAVRLVSQSQSTKPHALGALIAEKAETFYIVSLWGDANVNPDPILDAARAGWRWTKIEPPVNHMELGDAPIVLPGDRLSVRLPVIARPDSQPATEAAAVWFINNTAAGREELTIEINQAPHDPKATPVQVRDAFFASTQKSLGLKAVPVTRPVAGKRDAWVTDWVQLSAKDREGKPASRLVRYVVWVHAPGRVVLCQFMLNAESQEHQARYAALADDIVASLGPARK